MQLNKTILLVLALFSLSSQAFETASQIRTDDDKLNSFSFSSSSFQEDIAFCNKILEPVCKGKNCKAESIIQQEMSNICKAAANDKLSLMKDFPDSPMGPINFFPHSYSGYAVFFSRFQELLTLSSETNDIQYKMYLDYFREIKSHYIDFDTKNIKTSFAITGKYLEDKRNINKPFRNISHKWATEVMSSREMIQKQIISIESTLKNQENLQDFKIYSKTLIPKITSSEAYSTYRGSVLTDKECKFIFRILNDDYISDLYKNTQFECEKK